MNILANRKSFLFIAAMMIFSLVFSTSAIGQGGQPAEVQQKVSELRNKAKKDVSEKRLQAQEKSQEKRQEACERRADKISGAIIRISSQAERLLGVMDDFHERVEGFYESGQLTVSNYDELIGNVDEAQSTATTSVEALDELEFAVDCEDSDIAEAIAAYREAAGEVKEDLKDYRKALVELISSMRAEAAEDNASNDGDDSTEAEETEDESEVEDETESENEEEQETETETEDGTQDDETTGPAES